MGWSIGFDNYWQRDIGYGVPAICDHPDCEEPIHRGLGHVCGSGPYGGDEGCGLFFCSDHLFFPTKKHADQLCSRCFHGKPSHKPKPDIKEWIKFKMTDPSWAEWRKKNK